MIRKLHHSAYRCRDSEETRRFYEDFLGLRLAGSLQISETKTGRNTSVLHTFYELDDGSYIAFFEDPETPFDFKPQRDYDLHIALEVDPAVLQPMLDKGRAADRDARHFRSRLHSLDLFSRSQRLRAGADGEDAEPRAVHGSGAQRGACHS